MWAVSSAKQDTKSVVKMLFSKRGRNSAENVARRMYAACYWKICAIVARRPKHRCPDCKSNEVKAPTLS